MKKLILLLLFIPFLSASQTAIDKIPFVEDIIKFDSIIDINETAANVLYSRTKLIISELYQSGKSAIDTDDANALNIVVKGMTTYPLKDWMGTIDQKIEYTIIFQFKDNKVRIQFTDLVVFSVKAECIIRECKGLKYSQKVRQAHAEGIINVWNEIKNSYITKIKIDQNNW